MAVNAKYVEELDVEELLAAVAHVNAIEGMPEDKLIVTEEKTKEEIAEQLRVAVNACPGADAEVAEKLGADVVKIYTQLIAKEEVKEKKERKKREKKEKKEKVKKEKKEKQPKEKKPTNMQYVKGLAAEGKTEDEIYEILKEKYADKDEEAIRKLMKRYLHEKEPGTGIGTRKVTNQPGGESYMAWMIRLLKEGVSEEDILTQMRERMASNQHYNERRKTDGEDKFMKWVAAQAKSYLHEAKKKAVHG